MKNELAIKANDFKKQLQLKFPNLKIRVKTRMFSMGNSMDVTIIGKASEAEKREISDLVQNCQYGYFDGMIDCYEYNNKYGFTKFANVNFLIN